MRPPLIPIIVTAVMCLAQAPLRADGPQNVVKSILTLSPEIDCPSCEDNIKHSLITAHGVQSADIDVLNNRITIRYDARNITLKALVGRIRVYGYVATELK